MPAKNGFQLQDGDSELIHYVFQLRIATVDHLSSLSGRSVRALWNRLLKLKNRRYLAAVARFMQKQVYAIGSQGVGVLIEHGYAPVDLKDARLRHRELTEFGIRHSLFIADIHARLMLLKRSGPIRLARWREGPALWDTVTTPSAGAAIPIRPDAYFILKPAGLPEGKNMFHFFLEADRSTMSHSRMAQKIPGYLAYYEQGRHTKQHPGMKAFVVATVTETRRRAEELRNDLYSLIPRGSRHAYHFIALEDLMLAALPPKAAARTASSLTFSDSQII
jgi:hypothetical protein